MNDEFDLKLMMLRLIRNFWKVLLGTFLGALIIGLPYYLCNIVFAPSADYQSITKFHVEYGEDTAGNAYDYVNTYTWGDYVISDSFTHEVSQLTEGKWDIESIKGAIKVDVPADLRVVYLYVTTKNVEDHAGLAAACETAFLKLADEINEINTIQVVVKAGVPKIVHRDVRPLNAVLLGAVLGLFFTLLVMLILYITDDSVYIPLSFEKKYRISMSQLSWTAEDGIRIYIGNKQPDLPDSLAGTVVLEIESGSHNGKLIDWTINELGKREVKIAGAVLVHPDEKLIRCYFMPQKFPNPFMK